MLSLSRTIVMSAMGLALMAGNALAVGPATERDRVAPAVSKPSQMFELSMPMPGFAWKVPVKEGDQVKKGDLLVEQDIRLELKKLEEAKILAETDINVRAAEKERDTAKVNLDRVLKMGASASATERDQAQLAYDIAELKVESARRDQEIAKVKYEYQQVTIDMMRLFSTVDGVVSRVDISVGEVIEREKPAVTVVVNDPLFVETKLPTAMVAKLSKGEKLQVGYLNDNKWLEAEITFIQPMADASADRQLVRMTMRNPEGRDSGLQMVVKLPERLFQTSETGEQNAAANP